MADNNFITLDAAITLASVVGHFMLDVGAHMEGGVLEWWAYLAKLGVTRDEIKASYEGGKDKHVDTFLERAIEHYSKLKCEDGSGRKCLVEEAIRVLLERAEKGGDTNAIDATEDTDESTAQS